MATNFRLQPSPTFEATVQIPVPGADPAPVLFKFRHHSKAEIQKLFDEKPEDGVYLMSILTGWELDDEFNRENVDRLIDNYQGAANAISMAYLNQLRKGRLGN